MPSFELLSDPELLHVWAMNLMVLGVSTRKYGRATRLPADAGGDLPSAAGDGGSKSAVSLRFVALTRKKLKAWLASPREDLDLLVLQIDGLHVGDHVMVAAIGIDGGGEKHVLGLAEAATENRASVQALIDNRLLRNLARRLEHDAPGVSKSIQECLDEILTVIRLGLPPELRRSFACTNAIENALGTVRLVQRNVKRWRNAEMVLRWTAAGLLEAKKTFRRLKACRQLPILDAALRRVVEKAKDQGPLDEINEAS